MIIYFSGTGNSRAVAGALASRTSDEALALTSSAPSDIIYSGERLIFVFPIYSWGVSPLVLGYVGSLNRRFVEMASMHPVWVVCTCGDDTGRGPEMFERALRRSGLEASGIWDVHMPNNYVLLPGFDVDSKEVERRKIGAYPARVEYIAGRILGEAGERDYHAGKMAALKTGLVYPLFRYFGIYPERWTATDACVGCGICSKACPVTNIRMESGTPKWGADCVSCLACYHSCPRNAVQYGRMTRKKGQYLFAGHGDDKNGK